MPVYMNWVTSRDLPIIYAFQTEGHCKLLQVKPVDIHRITELHWYFLLVEKAGASTDANEQATFYNVRDDPAFPNRREQGLQTHTAFSNDREERMRNTIYSLLAGIIAGVL